MSGDDNNVQTEEAPAKRGRPRKVVGKRKYAKELTELQSRVDMAVHVLGNIVEPHERVVVALEILTGE